MPVAAPHPLVCACMRLCGVVGVRVACGCPCGVKVREGRVWTPYRGCWVPGVASFAGAARAWGAPGGGCAFLQIRCMAF